MTWSATNAYLRHRFVWLLIIGHNLILLEKLHKVINLMMRHQLPKCHPLAILLLNLRLKILDRSPPHLALIFDIHGLYGLNAHLRMCLLSGLDALSNL